MSPSKNLHTRALKTVLTGFFFSGIVLLNACAPDTGPGSLPSAKAMPSQSLPDFIIYEAAPVRHNGSLLDGGLGLAGLQSALPPALPVNADRKDQAAAIRRLALHSNIRALLDTGAAGGFGKVFGPQGAAALSVSGTEYLAAAKLDGQNWPFAISVLVPADFDAQKPCMVVAPSSGSRGVYGAIGLTGPWAFAHNCALVLTDKSTGTGLVVLDSHNTYGLDGVLREAGKAAASVPVMFDVDMTQAVKAYRTAHPGRIAFKHAHAQDNGQKDWGKTVLMAARYGAHVLARNHGITDKPSTIAASISNGGGAVIRAAELDQDGWLDAVVASEPNIYPPKGDYRVMVNGVPVPHTGEAFYTYVSLFNLFAPCAVLSPQLDNAPFIAITRYNRPALIKRCNALHNAGRLSAETLDGQIAQALRKVTDAGLREEAWPYLSIMAPAGLWPALSANYAMSHARASVEEALCDTSFIARAAFNAQMAPGLSSGIAPTAGLSVSYDGAQDDPEFAAAHCFRMLVENTDARLMAGLAQTRATGRLGENSLGESIRDENIRGENRPVVILHGRNDGLILPDHSSRPYVAATLSQSQHVDLRYYEIENAQHFDALSALPAMAGTIIPIQPYFEQALSLVLARLDGGAVLPPSQLVRTTLRQTQEDGTLEPLSHKHLSYKHLSHKDLSGKDLSGKDLGGIMAAPAENSIVFADGVLHIP